MSKRLSLRSRKQTKNLKKTKKILKSKRFSKTRSKKGGVTWYDFFVNRNTWFWNKKQIDELSEKYFDKSWNELDFEERNWVCNFYKGSSKKHNNTYYYDPVKKKCVVSAKDDVKEADRENFFQSYTDKTKTKKQREEQKAEFKERRKQDLKTEKQIEKHKKEESKKSFKEQLQELERELIKLNKQLEELNKRVGNNQEPEEKLRAETLRSLLKEQISNRRKEIETLKQEIIREQPELEEILRELEEILREQPEPEEHTESVEDFEEEKTDEIDYDNHLRSLILRSRYHLLKPNVPLTHDVPTSNYNGNTYYLSDFYNKLFHRQSPDRKKIFETFGNMNGWTVNSARGDGMCLLRAIFTNLNISFDFDASIEYRYTDFVPFFIKGLKKYFDNGNLFLEDDKVIRRWGFETNGIEPSTPLLEMGEENIFQVKLLKDGNYMFDWNGDESTLSENQLEEKFITLLRTVDFNTLDANFSMFISMALGMNIIYLYKQDAIYNKKFYGKWGEFTYIPGTSEITEDNSIILLRDSGAHFKFVDCLDRIKMKDKIVEICSSDELWGLFTTF